MLHTQLFKVVDMEYEVVTDGTKESLIVDTKSTLVVIQESLGPQATKLKHKLIFLQGGKHTL